MGNLRQDFQKAVDHTRLGLVSGMAIAPFAVMLAMGGATAMITGGVLAAAGMIALIGTANISLLRVGQGKLHTNPDLDPSRKEEQQQRLDRVMQQFNDLKQQMDQPDAILQLGECARALPGNIIHISPAEAEDYSPEEMEFVLAHELAHLKNGDTNKPIAMTTLIAGFGLPAMMLPACLFTPIPAAAFGLSAAHIIFQLWCNRMTTQICEDRADRTALSVTKDIKAAKSWMRKDLTDDISKSKPAQWRKQLYHHHSVGDIRIKRAAKAAKNLT